MKIIVRILLVISAAIIGLIFWDSARFTFAPRSTANEIAGFKLPEDAQFIERGGDSKNAYFKWKVEPHLAATLEAPEGSKQLFDYKMVWHPFDLGFFGKLQDTDVADDAEALYYRMPVWDVALIRSRSENTLIVAGIYTN